jgi:preprotein translocase subunit SecA
MNSPDPTEKPQAPEFHIHGPGCNHSHDHSHHEPAVPYRREEPKPGRNDPCFCGSGKKYKKCHGAGG